MTTQLEVGAVVADAHHIGECPPLSLPSGPQASP